MTDHWEKESGQARNVRWSVEQRAQASETCREKNTEAKKSVRKDKRDYTDSQAREEQTAAEKGDTRIVYTITKQLTGRFTNRATVLKHKDGIVLMKEEGQLKRWAEHYKEILKRPDPEVEAVIEAMGFSIEMNRGRITQAEIAKAIRQTTGNRAPGKDIVSADKLKEDPAASARLLKYLSTKYWMKRKYLAERNRSEIAEEGWSIGLWQNGEASIVCQYRESCSAEFSYNG